MFFSCLERLVAADKFRGSAKMFWHLASTLLCPQHIMVSVFVVVLGLGFRLFSQNKPHRRHRNFPSIKYGQTTSGLWFPMPPPPTSYNFLTGISYYGKLIT